MNSRAASVDITAPSAKRAMLPLHVSGVFVETRGPDARISGARRRVNGPGRESIGTGMPAYVLVVVERGAYRALDGTRRRVLADIRQERRTLGDMRRIVPEASPV